MQKTTKDLYKLLGLSRGASQDDVRKAHRKLVREYHPDTNPGDRSAEERFKEIQQAYEVLSDPQKRREYDELLRTSSRGNAGRPRAEAAGKTRGESPSAVDLSEILSKLRDLIRDIRTGRFSATYKDVSAQRPSRVGDRPREKRVKGPRAQGKEKRVKGPRAQRKRRSD